MASCATTEDDQKLLDAIASLKIEEAAVEAEVAITAVDPTAPDEEVVAKAEVAEQKEEALKAKVEEAAAATSMPVETVTAALKSFLEKKDRDRVMDLMKGAQTVDLLFVVDATGSMTRVVHAVKETIRQIIGELQTSLKYLKFQIGCVAYRDVCDESNDLGRFTIHPFAGSISGFEKFLTDLRVGGGGDAAEDVIGGLAKALEMPWKWHNKILILCGDAPCHGSQYYDPKWAVHGAAWDEYPDGAFKDSQPVGPILKALREKGVQITFLRINDSTDKMIAEFNKEAGEGAYINSTEGFIKIGSDHIPDDDEAAPADVIAAAVKKSVKDSVTGSVSRSETVATSAAEKGARHCAHAIERLGAVAEEPETPIS